ncbi:DUF4097 family beta strand repeat-containing protein [Staphylococcus caeli]|uniref:Exported protein n=1 Tax=Staphylococcus caeli TaxID=2201815 RepID=A0A1D4RL75_9STAP|nr:DUF4097 family beta strand repeat-containing protein [Staphylococcus caeli]SCT26864.1 exported protein [Staphylococcus caeli]SCT48284.1 exported protein [Staphylococcus caeli]
MKKLFIVGLTLFVVCFLLGCITWFGFEKQSNKVNSVNKTFDDNKIDSLNIKNAGAKVNVVKGDHFEVHYKGINEVDIKQQNNELVIEDTKKRVDWYGLNFNPFRKVRPQMEITVPDKKLKQLKVSNNRFGLQLKALEVGNVDISTAGDTIFPSYIDSNKIDNLKYKSEEAPIRIKNSSVKNALIKTKRAEIKGSNSLIKDGVLSVRKGSLNLSSMDIDSAFKASSKNGDINMSYNNEPKDVLLKLNPEDGQANVRNKSFKNDKVGSGNHILELYTLHGDINIK